MSRKSPPGVQKAGVPWYNGEAMKIHGLNKLTLLDYPGLTACTVFTGGCNFRCPFCHNAVLVLDPDSQPVIDEEEIFAYLEKRKRILEGVCVTGGEPTLDPDLHGFAERIKKTGYKVKLDTNGTRPDVLKRLVRDGLADYVAMDIKNSPERYGLSTGMKNPPLREVMESVEFLKTGVVDYEFRTTVVKGLNDGKSFGDVAEWLAGAEKYYLQVFRGGDGLIDTGTEGLPVAEMEEFLPVLRKKIKKVEIRGAD